MRTGAAKHPIRLIARVARYCTDFLLPRRCVFCGEDDLAHEAATVNICDQCCSAILPDAARWCGRCGAVAGPYSDTSEGCTHCRRRPFRFDSVVALGMYESLLREAILKSKWSWSSVGVESLAELLVQQRDSVIRGSPPDIVLPIPQHRRVRLSRHFNAADQIAEVLGRRLKIPVERHVLRRLRQTRPQKRVSVQQRYANQKDSFRLQDSWLVKDRHVLLVDDVLTTGATCSEAARLLKSAGAASCRVAVIARVLTHRT